MEEPPAVATDAPRFDPAKIEAAKTALLQEPKIMDLHFEDAGPVEWQIGTLGLTNPAFGYADYLCLKLRDHDLVLDHTRVRIVDLASVEAQTGDFRGGSLGMVDCSDGTRSFP